MSYAANSFEREKAGSPEFFIFGISLPLLSGFGLFGNIALLIIFNIKKQSSSPSVYLTFHYAIDLIYSSLAIFLFTSEYVDPSSSSPLSSRIYSSFSSLIDCIQVMMSGIVLLMTFDYYIYLFKAVKSIRYNKADTAVKLGTVTCGSILVFNLFNFFKYRIIRMEFKDGSTRDVLCTSDLYVTDFFHNYDKYGYVILFVILPFICIIIFNILIIILLKYEDKESVEEKLKNCPTLKLHWSICIIRLICEIPYISYKLAAWSVKEPDEYFGYCNWKNNVLNYTGEWISLELSSVFFHSVYSNFKFYLFFIISKNFRSSVYSLVTCKWNDLKISVQSNYNYNKSQSNESFQKNSESQSEEKTTHVLTELENLHFKSLINKSQEDFGSVV